MSDAQVDATAAVAFLPKPAPPAVLDAAVRLAVHRARELRDARADADSVRRRLNNRTTVERAKGILMKRTGYDEAAAYRVMQKSAQDRGMQLVILAQMIIAQPPPWDFLAGASATD